MVKEKRDVWDDVQWKREEFPFLKGGKEYVDELMREIDINVKELIDVFKFSLKYRILFKGSGLEFAGLKEYVPGQDDASKIDWKASLRSKTLYIKQFEEERDLDVYLLLDTSSSMLFGSQERLKSEYAAVLAGAIIYAAIEAGDNVGYALFNDKIVHAVPPQKGNEQYYRALQFMADPRNYGGGCNLEQALNYLLNNLRSKTILFIISDFIGIGDAWEDSLKMTSGKLDRVLGVMLRDVRDSTLPEGVGNIRLSDPFGKKGELINLDKVREEYNRLAAEQEKRVEQIFTDSRALFAKIYTTESFVKPLVRYIELGEITSGGST